MTNKTYVLRGFIKEREGGRFVGVCIQPNLVVEGASQEEALRKLQDLIHAYVRDSVEDGQLEHFMAQKAPLDLRAEYWFGRCLTGMHKMRRSFYAFSEARQIPSHA